MKKKQIKNEIQQRQFDYFTTIFLLPQKNKITTFQQRITKYKLLKKVIPITFVPNSYIFVKTNNDETTNLKPYLIKYKNFLLTPCQYKQSYLAIATIIKTLNFFFKFYFILQSIKK